MVRYSNSANTISNNIGNKLYTSDDAISSNVDN